METRGHQDPPRGRPGRRASMAEHRRRRHAPSYPCHRRHLVDADLASCSRPWTRRPPAEVLAAADDLHYRDFLTVALVVPAETGGVDDNWIYIHAPEVKTMRIQNFGSWSPYLVKDGKNVLGLEYFVFEGDDVWNAPDDELIEQGKRELDSLGPGGVRRHRGRLRRAHAQGVPDLRRALPGQRRRAPRLARGQHAPTSTRSGATACTGTTTRTTPCTRPCSRSRTSSTAPTTTSGTVNVEEEYHEEKAGAERPTTSGTGPRRPGPPPCGHRGRPLSPQRLTPPARPRRPPPAGRGASR